MDAPRLLVIGQGSIGRRHAANLAALGAEVAGVDVEFDTEYQGRVPDGVDGVVVASPSTLHGVHARAALAAGCPVLVEKPLATSVDEAVELAAAGERVMVGYNLRHHAPLRRVADLLADGVVGRPCSYRLWFGSWLPDWRPGTDYRTSYSARAELGGGVLDDAIHELDLALWFTGAAAGPTELTVRSAFVDRIGPLEIDVEDTVRALLTTPDGVPVTVELDYLSRRYRRGVEVIGDAATLRYDWATGVLSVEGGGEMTEHVEHVDTPVAASYEAEAAAFLAVVRGEAPPTVDGPTGLASVRLAAAIREAAA